MKFELIKDVKSIIRFTAMRAVGNVEYFDIAKTGKDLQIITKDENEYILDKSLVDLAFEQLGVSDAWGNESCGFKIGESGASALMALADIHRHSIYKGFVEGSKPKDIYTNPMKALEESFDELFSKEQDIRYLLGFSGLCSEKKLSCNLEDAAKELSSSSALDESGNLTVQTIGLIDSLSTMHTMLGISVFESQDDNTFARSNIVLVNSIYCLWSFVFNPEDNSIVISSHSKEDILTRLTAFLG